MTASHVVAHDSERCRIVRETFDRLGDKWSLLIVSILSGGPLRFTTLKYAAEGISQRMLTLTLRKLEREAPERPKIELCAALKAGTKRPLMAA